MLLSILIIFSLIITSDAFLGILMQVSLVPRLLFISYFSCKVVWFWEWFTYFIVYFYCEFIFISISKLLVLFHGGPSGAHGYFIFIAFRFWYSFWINFTGVGIICPFLICLWFNCWFYQGPYLFLVQHQYSLINNIDINYFNIEVELFYHYLLCCCLIINVKLM